MDDIFYRKTGIVLKNRIYSLLIPLFMDGSLSLVQTAMPLLAVQLGASAVVLGSIGWISQAVRLPICFTSGHISEKIGRKTLIVPAAISIAIASFIFSKAYSITHVTILYAVIIASIGSFYPPLQAHIGDVSRRGQLTKNLGMFNIGWCVGGGVMAVVAARLIYIGIPTTFIVAAVGCAVAGLLVLFWKADTAGQDEPAEDVADQPEENTKLLLIARLGHFTGFFGFATIRVLFPKVGISTLHWSEPEVAWAVAFLPIGQGVGMLLTTASPWWRGKLWPQIMAQGIMLVSGLIIAAASSRLFLTPAFFAVGFSLSIAYTAALYHGLAARKKRGKNTGIHEALVAAGGISGCLVGGLLADKISPQAPYIALSILATACLVVTVFGAGMRRFERV